MRNGDTPRAVSERRRRCLLPPPRRGLGVNVLHSLRTHTRQAVRPGRAQTEFSFGGPTTRADTLGRGPGSGWRLPRPPDLCGRPDWPSQPPGPGPRAAHLPSQTRPERAGSAPQDLVAELRWPCLSMSPWGGTARCGSGTAPGACRTLSSELPGPRGRALRPPLRPQDAFQEQYCRTGTFPGTPMVPPRRPWALLNWLFWASLLLCPFVRFLVSMVSSGSSLTLASFVLVLFVGKWGARGWGAHAARCPRRGRAPAPVGMRLLAAGPSLKSGAACGQQGEQPQDGGRTL